MKNTIIFLCLFVSIGAFAQSGNAAHVPVGSVVQVTMNSNMGNDEQDQIIQGLNLWNGSLSGDGCIVSYQIFPTGSTLNWPWTNGALSANSNGLIPGSSTTITSSGGIITNSSTIVNTIGQGTPIQAGKQGATTIFTKIAEHETGHTLGETDANGTNGQSVMDQIGGIDDVNGNIPVGITALDQGLVDSWCVPPPPPSGGGGCLGGDGGNPGDGGGDGDAPDCSPIIIDTKGEGFHLTSAITGVTFDISGTGHPIQIAWTDIQFHNAFLALPGPDGLVHSGKELFGNFTPQPPSAHPNGFLALAQFDKPENGGNGDGSIDQRDDVFSRLRLWIDENHDGICQPEELHRLPELGVYSLALNYVDSSRTDQFGNQFRYKAQVNPGVQKDPRDQTPTGEPGRWTYDVFLVAK